MKRMLVVVVVVLGLGGCGDDEPNDMTTTTASRTTRARVGSTIALEGSGGLKVDVSLVKVVDPAGLGESGPTMGRFVALQLRLTNSGRVRYSDTPADGATLIDAEGQQYTAALIDTAVGTGFGDGIDLDPGGSFLGFLTFDVPSGAVLAKLQLTLDSGPADNTGEWSLR